MKYTVTQRNKIIHEVNGFAKVKKFNFSSLELYLNKHSLIPHPDTFQLVLQAVEVLENNSWINTVADVGTGSGVIVVSLAKKFPGHSFFASDVCDKTLNIAKKNSVLNKTNNIHFLHNTDKVWLSEYKNINIDFIVSNPPFVGEREFCNEDFLLRYPEVKLEPAGAIVTDGDKYGLSPYLEIIKNSDTTNTKLYLFQCNSENIKSLVTEIQKIIKCKIKIIKDAAGLDRFLLISKI